MPLLSREDRTAAETEWSPKLPPLELADLTLGNFTAKKILGMGSSGKAELVECHSNGCQYAMKTIQGVFDEEHGVQVQNLAPLDACSGSSAEARTAGCF